MTDANTALVIGATGVSGRALLSHLERQPGWSVIGASRKPPYFPTSARFVSVDLADPESCRAVLGGLSDVTHVFYTAYQDNPVIAETREPNTRMFRNAMAAIEPAMPGLRHVCILQGTKYYGQYLGPFKTPAKEDDPRIDVPHFYYDQQDHLEALQRGKGWSWSAARPHVICGYALGNPLNIVSTIALYATLRREAGRPLTFPGKPGAFSSIYQATDAGLLARAMVWMATEPRCANQAFNITNGDFFRYQHLWPVFARYFGMEPGGVETEDLDATMAGQDTVWDRIAARENLQPHPLSLLVNWKFANYAFSNDWDVMSDTTKCRKFGFLEFIDSQEMFLEQFDILKRERIIPGRDTMPYLIETADKPGTQALRAQVRRAHVEYLKAHQHLLLAAGATLEDDGVTATGTLYIVDTEERAAAERFAAADPFAQAGLFARTSVKRWRKAFFGFENTMPPDWDKPPAGSDRS